MDKELTKDQAAANLNLVEGIIKSALDVIEQPRERDVLVGRFGLDGQKKTLEEVGKSLNITRERVRQLEKATIVRLTIHAEDGKIAGLKDFEKLAIRNLSEMGRVATLKDFADKLLGDLASRENSQKLYFLVFVSPQLTAAEKDGTNYQSAVAIAECGDSDEIHKKIDAIVKIVQKAGEPVSVDDLDKQLDYEHPSQIVAMASLSRRLAIRDDKIGLRKWSSVNPRTIRDRVYSIISAPEYGQKPTHFREIARLLNETYTDRQVSYQAVHNELIKDKRFVIVGRGIYALVEWGYEPGTVKELITRFMERAGHPLTREEVVREVLKNRIIKESTVLLNLQNRHNFKKVDKNSYYLLDK